ncbi:species-specific tRNA processing, variant 3 [Trebouxia sp. C0010 RCD-2024]
MAGAVAVSSGKPGKRYNAKVTGYVWFLCLIGGSGGLLLGYDNGVIGGVTSMRDFQSKFFRDVYVAETGGYVVADPVKAAYCKYNNQVLQLVVSSLYISALFSGLVASKFARLYGRKPVNIVAGAFFIIGAAILAGAVDVAMLVVGRVLLGVGVGFCSLVMPMYNAEVAPPHLRGGMNILFQWFVTFGILCAGLINYGCSFINGWGWRLALGLSAVPGFIVFLGGLVMPESPTSLIERGHYEKARRVLTRIRGTSDIEEELEDMAEAARVSNLAPHPMRNLFKSQYRPQLVISLMFMMFQQFTGINAIIFYAPVLFNSIGSGHTAALLNTVIIGAVNVLATVVAIVVVDRLGRKFLLIAGVIQMVIAEIVVGVTLKYEFVKYQGSLPSPPSIGILVCICVFIAGFAWSWGPIGWLYPT